MTRIIINAADIQRPDDFYTELGKKIRLPGHFGRNLDALWDFLSTDFSGALEITWKGFKEYSPQVRKDLEGIVKLFTDLRAERPGITLVLK